MPVTTSSTRLPSRLERRTQLVGTGLEPVELAVDGVYRGAAQVRRSGHERRETRAVGFDPMDRCRAVVRHVERTRRHMDPHSRAPRSPPSAAKPTLRPFFDIVFPTHRSSSCFWGSSSRWLNAVAIGCILESPGNRASPGWGRTDKGLAECWDMASVARGLEKHDPRPPGGVSASLKNHQLAR